MGPRSAVLGLADACGTPPGALRGAPYGATKRCIGCGRCMWYPPLGPSVELLMVPRNAVLGVANACSTPPVPSVEFPTGLRN
eukprot:2171964-Pyramimonas_sp.AAC.1